MAELLEKILSYAGEKPVMQTRGEQPQRIKQFRVVSVDDHVTEPPDLFVGRLPAGLESEAPRVERDSEGHDWWVFDNDRVPLVGSDSWAGFEPETRIPRPGQLRRASSRRLRHSRASEAHGRCGGRSFFEFRRRRHSGSQAPDS